jgi:hypothetical protein
MRKGAGGIGTYVLAINAYYNPKAMHEVRRHPDSKTAKLINIGRL